MFTGCQALQPLDEIRAKTPDAFIEVAGQQVHVERWGEGAPDVVLLHGMAASSYSYRLLGPEVARWAPVVAVDLNGFGFTERPQNPEEYTLGGQSAMVRRTVESLGARKIVLVGHSYGALVAIELAARHPELVKSLVLISPPVTEAPMPWYLRSRVVSTAMYPVIRSFLSRPVSFRAAFARAFHRADAFSDEDSEAYRERLLVEGLWDAYRGLTAAVVAGGPSPVRKKTAELKLPITVLAGRHDEVVSLESLEKFAASIPGIELVVLEASGHSSPEEEPQRVADLIRRFHHRSSLPQ